MVLGSFSARTPQNVVNLVWNFDQWCVQDDASDDMLWLLLKYEEMVEIGPKILIFWLILRFFFVHALFHPTSYTSRFCQVKYLTKIYICGKFHQYSKYVCEVESFESSSYWFSIYEIAPFWDFWTLTFPNIVRSCWNFDQR